MGDYSFSPSLFGCALFRRGVRFARVAASFSLRRMYEKKKERERERKSPRKLKWGGKKKVAMMQKVKESMDINNLMARLKARRIILSRKIRRLNERMMDGESVRDDGKGKNGGRAMAGFFFSFLHSQRMET